MTPEERAEGLARAGACGQGTTEQRAKVAAAIRAAVEDERRVIAGALSARALAYRLEAGDYRPEAEDDDHASQCHAKADILADFADAILTDAIRARGQ